MSKDNSWVVWVAALIAVVALIVAIVALGKISATGEAISWSKPKVDPDIQKIKNVVRAMMQDQVILWAHDGMSCNQECVRQAGNKQCMYAQISWRQNVNPSTGQNLENDCGFGPGYDLVHTDIMQDCDAVYQAQMNLTKCGERLMVCSCI
jgi:hypothetical protein